MSDHGYRAFFGSLIAVLLLPASTALACSPIKSIGILFERNSAHAPAEQVFKLANWTAMLRARYPNREAFFMTSQADFGERDASRLGVQRARNVAKFLSRICSSPCPKSSFPAKATSLQSRRPWAASWSSASMSNFCPRARTSARVR